MLESGTKHRSPEFQSMEGHPAVAELSSRNWELHPLAVPPLTGSKRIEICYKT